MGKKIICVDFDGVLHSYRSGWKGVGKIPDEPVHGAFEFLRDLVLDDRFEVCIYSSRSGQDGGAVAMMEWLEGWGFPNQLVKQIRFPTKKPPAFLTIDDRCFCFEGKFPKPDEIDGFVPWNRAQV